MELKIIKKSNELVWSKTILSIYRTLDTLISAIDNLVLCKGKNSNHYSHMSGYNTLEYMNNVISLIERKKRLINLKLIIEEMLLKMDSKQQRLLVLTFFDNAKSAVVADALGISLRTYFRKKEQALTSFACLMKNSQFNGTFFEENYADERWLMDYYFYNSKNYSDENAFSSKITSFALRELKSS